MQKARPHSVASTPITDTDSPGPRSRIESNRSLQYTTPIRTPVQQRVGTSTRPLKPAFSTPFKQGMRPGEPGRESLGRAQKVRGEIGTSRKLPPGRIKATGKVPLRESGLIPQQYTPEELEDMGVNIAELKQITPQTAPFYVFHTSASYIPSTQSQAASGSSGLSLGPKEAQDHLRKAGRNATQEWVENQWALVLWKLAGLATLDPTREATPSRRWCWRSVLEQLEARYDKELEKGARPALRLITTGDAPAGSPLVLVITAILSSERERLGPNGRVVQDASAEIEVSDGWYRLRASVDAPLARAVIRGIIRPGRKIAVAGAKLDNLKKDPCEILEAYNSCILTLSGNGSHLAPWHGKLGFQTEPFVATLGSLTPDGGPVPLVDIIVEKVHPIAFLEFLPGDRPGEKIREGPRGEAEEAATEDAWRKRRDAAESKVRDELSVRWSRWEGFADRLERSAGSKFNPCPDDMPPDHIEDLLDELDALDPAEVGDFVRQLAADECGWLARYLRQRLERDRERALEEIEVEVKHTCPPREVRNFRIVQVRDARTARRPANRIAHLCIWDVLSLCVAEGGKAGAIESGQRFLMTSLVPMQRSCWMGRAKDDMVYLSTTRNTRFYRLK
ncbi:uncharacterized protein FOMMEDRAFT_128955 [Fomitiporia mediterranea MF3/22]|uniref:uncharacterized protein n=1 Tax=Fomitiporia mediterranea (strain MF3/22) TaxID=694068 RepID=UPI00044081F4|nr:uncharacterized protein FOMMEDRAFT_128955 [Fomitiporia mediterranea MF3/22]EJC98658.1 hypothetical protein FOMMEDRAFT_128955 [Fomitiporia mediterranea MF3/22]